MDHILVAEDEEHTRRSLALILRKAGYAVSMAKDGHEALDLVVSGCDGDEPFSLLLCDIEMPGMTGFELIDEMNNLKLGVPVLAMTGYGDRKTIDELRQRDRTHFLPKPFDKVQLLGKIREVIGMRSAECGTRNDEE